MIYIGVHYNIYRHAYVGIYRYINAHGFSNDPTDNQFGYPKQCSDVSCQVLQVCWLRCCPPRTLVAMLCIHRHKHPIFGVTSSSVPKKAETSFACHTKFRVVSCYTRILSNCFKDMGLLLGIC